MKKRRSATRKEIVYRGKDCFVFMVKAYRVVAMMGVGDSRVKTRCKDAWLAHSYLGPHRYLYMAVRRCYGVIRLQRSA